MVNVGSEEPAQIVTKLRQALDAVNRLSSERAALEEALKVRRCLILTATNTPGVASGSLKPVYGKPGLMPCQQPR